jgi:hypothetical protein
MAKKSIEQHQYRAAYEAGLQHHSDASLGIQAALKKIASTGINAVSGSNLISNVGHMLSGAVYKREMSHEITESYLRWIRADRGEGALALALKALRQHIGYYEAKYQVTRHGLRAILQNHEAVLATKAGCLLVTWNDKESAAFVDVLPLELFAATKPVKGFIHVVRHLDGTEFFAKCDVMIASSHADLDYEAHADFNKKNGMLLGVARLHFADADRTAVRRVQWKPAGTEAFTDSIEPTTMFMVPPSPPYLPPKEASHKKANWVRERPGQAKFRRALKSVYNLCCCFTGCTVAEALEGAHIDPYRSPASDNIRNGLLLRRDVHALFDKHFISVEPGVFTIHVCKQGLGTTDYADLHGKTLSLPTDPSHRPDCGALSRHWNIFVKKHPLC